MLDNKRILVTGAGGFIGSNLVEGLQRNRADSPGLEIHALDRNLGKLSQLDRQDGFTFHDCNLKDDNALQHLMKSVCPHVVIHLASSPDAPQSAEHSRSSIANNLVATVNLLDAFACSDNPHGLVYGDSTKVYGSAPPPYRSDVRPAPNSAYSITKAAGWDFIKLQARLSGFHAVAIRPTLIYGARQPKNIISVLLDAIQSKQPQFSLQGGSQTRAPLHIDDAVQAFLSAVISLKHLDSKVINIGGAEELSVAEIAERVVHSTNSNMKILCENAMRKTEILQSTVDLSEAKELLGWSPSILFSDGIRLCQEDIVQESNITSGVSS